jgi:ABC-type transporter Mla maintaining outer membrane lipid asymmetry ATPase subunit MlaF
LTRRTEGPGGVEPPRSVARAGRSGIGAHRPRILFLDKPTSGLDPQTRNQIWELIRGLCRDENVTVFFTTHYVEEAERVADRTRSSTMAGSSRRALPRRCGKRPAAAPSKTHSSR